MYYFKVLERKRALLTVLMAFILFFVPVLSNLSITVKADVNGVKLDNHSLSMVVGAVEQLTVVVDSEIKNKLIWTSSNPEIASVNNGIIRTRGTGTVTITVKTDDDKYSDSATIIVNEPVVSNVKISGDPYPGYFLKGNFESNTDNLNIYSYFKFQWYQSSDDLDTNKTPIIDATDSSYRVTDEDLDKYISWEVTNTRDNTTVKSNPILIKSLSGDNLKATSFNGTLTTDKVFKSPTLPSQDPTDVYNATQITSVENDDFNYFYINVTPTKTGNYTLFVDNAQFKLDNNDTVNDSVLFIYNNFFDSANPLTNLLVGNDDMLQQKFYKDKNRALSYIPNMTLQAGENYVLVLTTWTKGLTGDVSFKGIGPGSLDVTVPNPISDFSVIGSHNKAKFTFSQPTNATDVKLQQSTDGGHTWSTAASTHLTESSTTSEVTGLTDGDTYEYRLNVTGGTRSGISNVVTVTPNLTDSEIVRLDKDAMSIHYGPNDSSNHVSQNILLPGKGENGSTISWTSSDTSLIENDGTVHLPSYNIGNKLVTLSASISKGEANETKEFKLTVLRKEPEPKPDPTPNPVPVPVPTPGAPVVNEVKDNSRNITGKTDAGLKVTVKAGSEVLGTATADATGNFSLTLTLMQKAGTILTVTSEKDGNISPETKVTVMDRTPPYAPVVNLVKNNNRNITGKAESGSTVIVKEGLTILGTTIAEPNGNFSITLKSYPKAGRTLTVIATDQAGNSSSAVGVTVKDTTPPAKPIVKEIKSKDQKITGKAEVGAKVTVKAGSRVIGTAIVDSKGSFTITLKSPLKAGTVVMVVAKDKAGNESSATRVVVKK